MQAISKRCGVSSIRVENMGESDETGVEKSMISEINCTRLLRDY